MVISPQELLNTFPSQGVIREDELYTLDEFKERMKVKKAAWREMLRNGMPVIRQGNRAYVNGREAIRHMSQRSGQQR